MSIRVRWGSVALLALILAGQTTVRAGTPARAAYVVGSSDASLARVDLDTRDFVPGLATLGSLANRIEVAGDLTWAAIACSGSDEVEIFDLGTESVTGSIALPTGSNPWTVEITGGRLFATALAVDTVYELDPGALAVVDSAETGKAPEGMCAASGRLWITNTGFDFGTFSYDPGTVSVLDLADLSLVATVPVGLNPQECLLAPNGTVHVICTGDFFTTAGTVHVLDAATAAPLDTLDVAGYPGGGAVSAGGDVILNVLTFAFGAEIWQYDSASLTWSNDGSDPLFATSDFLGNPRVTATDHVVIPDFDADLLVIEDLGASGAPEVLFVNDGPIDVGLVERDGPVPVLLSGLSATDADGGVRLAWRAATDAGVFGFVVERKTPAHAGFETVASDLPPRREAVWLDRDVLTDVPYTYRVGAVRASDEITWSTAITFVRRPVSDGRLAVRRVFPNPSRGQATFDLHLPRPGDGSVEILDVRGRRVVSIDAGTLAPGPSTVVWNGRDAGGGAIAPGIYFARVRVGAETAVTRILRVR